MTLSNSTIIIADDLTGANDTALQFFKSGRSTKIIIDSKQDFSDIDDADVLAISTESRNIDKKEALEKILDICEKFQSIQNSENYYKKIDSTMRGNIGLEVLAMLKSIQFDAAVIAPAYIEEKRTTIGSFQLLDGIPIERTQAALDPKAPIYESYIPNIIKKDYNSQLETLIDTIDFKTVTKGAGPITIKLNELIQKGKKIIVLDAVSKVDLEQIVLAIHKSNYKILPVGSAGLANAINRSSNKFEKMEKISHIPDIATLLISGSATQLTAKQIQKIKEKQENTYFVDLKVNDIVNGINEDLVKEICSKLDSKIDVVVHASYIKQELLEENAQNLLINAGIAKNEFSNKITDYLANLLEEINKKAHYILITIGGETSYKCAHKINSKYLQILDVIMPAIPLCVDANGQIIVTKSGNFGTDETVLKILEYFKQNQG